MDCVNAMRDKRMGKQDTSIGKRDKHIGEQDTRKGQDKRISACRIQTGYPQGVSLHYEV